MEKRGVEGLRIGLVRCGTLDTRLFAYRFLLYGTVVGTCISDNVTTRLVVTQDKNVARAGRL